MYEGESLVGRSSQNSSTLGRAVGSPQPVSAVDEALAELYGQIDTLGGTADQMQNRLSKVTRPFPTTKATNSESDRIPGSSLVSAIREASGRIRASRTGLELTLEHLDL